MLTKEAQLKAKSMANERYVGSFWGKPWRYFLRDNPYYKKHPGHVIWHNSFYDECKILNRRLN